jgi:hypothetical protein
MSKLLYEITLSSPDNKFAVSIKSEDATLINDALPLAKKIQDKLLQVVHSPAPLAAIPASTPPQDPLQPPKCGVHTTPMVRMTGKTGSFWSCHKRNDDGSWCSYRPKPRRPDDGSVGASEQPSACV